ncbi:MULTISPECIES: DUF2163 domain-containing protein [unclassified Rhizobium]|uniref:DUF2163 domain-containing protein n=1 Tax=unclassified Rhizobium TaxID=2613769 RepID=UPI0006F30A41|nr:MULTISPECIES: DUF2163 domain-containing protein [unclassified Rhizobium]KQV43511.1 beta tubulin [Rhizobium sp. Root1212]KRD37696.1 beta tubulin [Rhizobium sp. Root268]
MRTLPADLAAHLQGDATTVCHCWRVTRRDGVVVGFTEHDRDLVVSGTVFLAASGFAASDSEMANGLSVDAGEVTGGFSADAIAEADVLAGRFDGAKVETFLVNWQAPEEHILLRVEEIGEVVRAGGAFRAELRRMTHRLGQAQGRVYSRRCDASFGDARCGVDVSGAAYRAEGAVVAVLGETRLVVSGLDGFSAGAFRQGTLVFSSGGNAGGAVDIEEHRREGAQTMISLWLPLPLPVTVGDAFVATVGCDKSFGMCRSRFGNGVNFRGFPHMPGSDFAFGYADGDTVHDGRALYEG